MSEFISFTLLAILFITAYSFMLWFCIWVAIAGVTVVAGLVTGLVLQDMGLPEWIPTVTIIIGAVAGIDIANRVTKEEK